ncbi:MAG TPA: hypothetical protein VK468_03235 [Pyrinomonadaceae bacterium]|nr:hypothetical protein [Pyrinomonadaceae bacterium]
MKRPLLLIITIAAMSTAVFADWKLTQKTKVSGDEMGRTTTIYQKGVRQRREDKIDMGMGNEDPEVMAMMAQMGTSMPTLPIQISQCDLKQDLFINEKNKAYFIDYYDWSSLPPERLKRRPDQKMVVKGTLTTDTVLTDSGRRQQMFGLTARWLKMVQTIEESADSCNGASSTKIEQEGWFVTLSLESESCPIQRPPTGNGGCRSRLIVKRAQNPGIMITGTMRMYEGSKVAAAFEIETLELSKATLDPALFDIPKDFTEVDSQQELMNKRGGPMDTSAKTVYKDGGSGPTGKVKTIAIDFFSGNSSKVDQDQLRGYISSKVTAAGMSGFPINSQSELASGNFANVIGVEITKIKESGASKIGGLFGKVTGSDDAAKLGNSSAEIVVTIYGKDAKTVVASSPSRAEVKGKGTDAVKAAIELVINGLLSKIK